MLPTVIRASISVETDVAPVSCSYFFQSRIITKAWFEKGSGLRGRVGWEAAMNIEQPLAVFPEREDFLRTGFGMSPITG